MTDEQRAKLDELRALREEIDSLQYGVQPVNLIAERERAEALKALFDAERELEDELGDLVELIDKGPVTLYDIDD